MTEQDKCSQINLGNPAAYRIKIGGDLDDSWSGYLGGLTIESTGGIKDASETVLTGQLIDQAALIGVLNNLPGRDAHILDVGNIQRIFADHPRAQLLQDRCQVRRGRFAQPGDALAHPRAQTFPERRSQGCRQPGRRSRLPWSE